MDLFTQLNNIEDLELQALLTNALKFSLHHGMIAKQAAAAKDNPAANEAAAIHRDTAIVMEQLVKRLLETAPPEPSEVPAPARKQRK